MTILDDDLAAIRAATTAADRQAALVAWCADATTVIDAVADNLVDTRERLAALRDQLGDVAAMLRRLAAAEESARRARSPFYTVV